VKDGVLYPLEFKTNAEFKNYYITINKTPLKEFNKESPEEFLVSFQNNFAIYQTYLSAYYINVEDGSIKLFYYDTNVKSGSIYAPGFMTPAGDLSNEHNPGIPPKQYALKYNNDGSYYFDIKISYLIRHNISIQAALQSGQSLFNNKIREIDFSYTKGGNSTWQKKLFKNPVVINAVDNYMFSGLYFDSFEKAGKKPEAGSLYGHLDESNLVKYQPHMLKLIPSWMGDYYSTEYIAFVCNLFVIINMKDVIGWKYDWRTNEIIFYKSVTGNNISFSTTTTNADGIFCNFIYNDLYQFKYNLKE
jgi:hypothetical protein